MNSPSPSHLLAVCSWVLLAPGLHAFQGKQVQTVLAPTWTTLFCHGTRQMTIEEGSEKRSETESTDTMKIVRRRSTLLVTVNGEEMQKAMKRDGYATDVYAIASAGKDGVTAIQGESLYPTAHSLVVASSGTLAIWTETGLTWYSSPVKPISTTILFVCRK